MRNRSLVPILALLAGFGLLAVAFGQPTDLPEPGLDPRAWFASVAAWAGAIVAAVALLKTHVIKSLTGVGTLAASFGIGVGGAVVASLVPFLGYDATVVDAAAFGVSASVLASGGWDAVRGVLTSVLGSKS